MPKNIKKSFLLTSFLAGLACVSLNGCGKKPARLEPPIVPDTQTVYPRSFPKSDRIPGTGPQRGDRLPQTGSETEKGDTRNEDRASDPFTTSLPDDSWGASPDRPIEDSTTF